MALTAALLVLSPSRPARAEPAELALAIGLLIFTIADGIYLALQPKHKYSFKYSCTDKDNQAGILIFTDPNYPNDALRVTVSRGFISERQQLHAVPVINRWDPNWAFVAGNGTEVRINTKNPADARFIDAKGTHSAKLSCSTTHPSKETLEHWTMTEEDKARITKLQEESRGPKVGTIYEVGAWDQDTTASRQPSQTDVR